MRSAFGRWVGAVTLVALGALGGVGCKEDDEGAAAKPVSFVFENGTGKTVYLPGGGHDFWALFRRTDHGRAVNRCETCDCSDMGCAVCGQAIPQVIEVPVGGRRMFPWDGREWVERAGKTSGIPCEEPVAAKAGALTVKVTYGFTTPAAGGSGTELADAQTVEQGAELPGARAAPRGCQHGV